MGGIEANTAPGGAAAARAPESDLSLRDGSRVAVLGGGPAGSFFSYFLLDMADRVDVSVEVDIYESRDFTKTAPQGCNMCGGIISESLVQHLAAEGIDLPSTIVQRGIDSYSMHMDVGSVDIATPLREKRIGAVYRSAGPRGSQGLRWKGLDAYLLRLAEEKGAHVVRRRVEEVGWQDGRPVLAREDGVPRAYDLLAVAAGVNTAILRQFEARGYRAPATSKTAIREYHLGANAIARHLGSAMHVFLLSIPRLEFAAIIPKGEYATVCVLGDGVDAELLRSFLTSPEVRAVMPPDWVWDKPACQCMPKIVTFGSEQPFADRLVFIGDSGVTRLYKDGIGAAYRAAKAAAVTAMFVGLSAQDFRRHYWKTCRRMIADNRIGRLIFAFTRVLQRLRFSRRAILGMTAAEQGAEGARRHMSTVLWDTFTGSAPYREILVRTLSPAFLGRLGWNLAVSVWPGGAAPAPPPPATARTVPQAPQTDSNEMEDPMGDQAAGDLGRVFEGGEIIMRAGDVADCMYVIQAGEVEVFQERNGREVRLSTLERGDVFGEMALFGREPRSASVRALGVVRVLTVDKKTFLRRVHEDPSLAFRILKKMAGRLRTASERVGAEA